MSTPDSRGLQGEPRPVPRTRHLQELVELATYCSELGRLFRDNGDDWYGIAFDGLGERTQALHDHEFDQSDLNALSADFPTPEWLMPKSLDYNAPRSSWQERAAELHQRARMVALDLRTIADYGEQ